MLVSWFLFYCCLSLALVFSHCLSLISFLSHSFLSLISAFLFCSCLSLCSILHQSYLIFISVLSHTLLVLFSVLSQSSQSRVIFKIEKVSVLFQAIRWCKLLSHRVFFVRLWWVGSQRKQEEMYPYCVRNGFSLSFTRCQKGLSNGFPFYKAGTKRLIRGRNPLSERTNILEIAARRD